MHRTTALSLLISLTVATAIIITGCGGGGDGDGGVPGPAGSATLTGKVVAANDTDMPLANAQVTVTGTGRTANTGADGSFTITGLDAGTVAVQVTTPQSDTYGTANAQVPLAAGETTAVNFAVLPIGLAAPEQILLDPINATIDVNGRIRYRSQVIGPDDQPYEGIAPTWILRGGVGSISPDGIFTARSVGSGQVTAYAGGAERSANVTVVGPRPPQISSFRVNPQTLPATGGSIFLSAAVSDGDGVRAQDVVLQILPAGGEPIEVPMEVTNPGTAIPSPTLPNSYTDATFGLTYQLPANSNVPTPDGIQAPKTYTVSIIARDWSGMSSQTQFLEVEVQGIDPPPVRPGI
ncbi:MAG: carboxypeptidase regulatory-like domain-containing protein [candidate division WS1 bacterium]|jgi:hypothetical protein|nr:carboxypeptidase regulatory-like domain-containing protein [candidate division WS1 bacterium]